MTEHKTINVAKSRIVTPLASTSGKPHIVINRNRKITVLKGENSKELFKNIMLAQAQTFFKEEVIYESCPGDFLKGLPHKVVLINRLNKISNSSRTIAKFTNISDGTVAFEKTSDRLTRLIGQNNYDLVFSTLCSVINLELKVRGIMALLLENQFEDQMCQTENKIESNLESATMVDKHCQTDENCMELIFKMKQKKRVKRSVLTPYVVKDTPTKKIKRVIIQPDNFPSEILQRNKEQNKVIDTLEDDGELPEIQLNSNSNEGSIGNLSSFSAYSNPAILYPNNILEMISQRTDNETNVAASLNIKCEASTHTLTPEVLKTIPSKEERHKLLTAQLILDWKTCLQQDEEGYLPIHRAVLNGDLDLLRRHCLVLRNKQESLDIPAGNMTALQMSIFQDTVQYTVMLLRYGADPLLTDYEHRTSLHLAAEVSSDHLTAHIQHITRHARDILQDHDELWKPAYELKSDAQLATILTDHMCQMVDGDGYTPLMLACKMGNYTNVRQLMDASPASLNLQNPNSGSTALFLAIEAACLDAANRANKSKVSDHFYKTIQLLIENDANPGIENLQGMNVHDLLGEINNGELSRLVCTQLVKKNGKAGTDNKIAQPTGPKETRNAYELNLMCIKKVNPDYKTDKVRKTKNVIPPRTGDKTKTKPYKRKPNILRNVTLPTAKYVGKDFCMTFNKTTPKDNLVTTQNSFNSRDKNAVIPSTSVGNNLNLLNTVDHKKTPDVVLNIGKRDTGKEKTVQMKYGGSESKKAKGS